MGHISVSSNTAMNGLMEILSQFTPALFEAVQKVLRAKERPRKRKARHDFPFTGLFRCAECGGMISRSGRLENQVIVIATIVVLKARSLFAAIYSRNGIGATNKSTASNNLALRKIHRLDVGKSGRMGKGRNISVAKRGSKSFRQYQNSRSKNGKVGFQLS